MVYISKEDNIFRVVHKIYKGVPLQTKSGDWIETGDKILKIHIHNYRLAQLIQNKQSEVHLAILLRNIIKQSLYGLSEYIQSLPNEYKVKGIIGTTMLNRGAERLGFTTHEVSRPLYNSWKELQNIWMYLLVHPQGLQYIKKYRKRLQPKHLVMTTEELLQRYSRLE